MSILPSATDVTNPVSTDSAARRLTGLLRANPGKISLTFSLVALENIVLLLYPLFAGFAIDAIVRQDLMMAMSYVVVILVAWTVGAVRRAVDTRVFTRIYADLAVSVAMEQRSMGQGTSTAAARVVLARDFVDFFEIQIPAIATTLFSMIGAVIMLMVIEPLVGAMSGLALVLCMLWIPRFARRNEQLHDRANNRLEREIGLVSRVGPVTLLRHYLVLSKLRVHLSDREATAYFAIGVIAALLFGFAIVQMVSADGIQAGHIYAVMTYLFTFLSNLDEAPSLVDQIARLKNIGKRITAVSKNAPEQSAETPSTAKSRD